ncbi:MAG: oxidative damage protection protein [Enterobacterales bacterium]|nr:oxidative damage protection protein [Enterobacterales bacterium]
MVFCQKLKKEADPIAFAPVPGELGQKIQQNISQEAWQLWMKHQTMLINEKHLSLADASARKYLTEQMEKFFFSDNYDGIDGYVPE